MKENRNFERLFGPVEEENGWPVIHPNESADSGINENGPDILKGKELEQLMANDFAQLQKERKLSASKSGVQVGFKPASAIRCKKCHSVAVESRMELFTRKSHLDFTGCIAGHARRFDIDAKVCGEVSFPLKDYKKQEGQRKTNRRNQVEHCFNYARMGAIEGFLIHFTYRPAGKKVKAMDPKTVFLPINVDLAFWQLFEQGDYQRIHRDEIDQFSIPVKWHHPTGKYSEGRPDLESMLKTIEADQIMTTG